MTNDLYRSSYRHLEVEPGSSWQEVRRAYKRSVKKWHPDHYHNDTKTQSIAAEKIKEINCAFDLLSKHYRAHGALPLPGEPATATPDYAGTTHPPGTHHAVMETEWPVEHAASETARQKNEPPTEVKKRSGTFSRLVVVTLVGWFGYTLWQTPDVSPESSTPPSSEPPGNAASAVDAADRNQPVPAQPKHYFTYGSTIGDVYAVQGIPTKNTDSLWYYGKSKVYFSNGKVTQWDEDPTSPLKASADVAVDHVAATAFNVGSTKAQVRSIQGQPLREWANVWEYGMSKVYFDGDRVSGWYDSTLNPLQVHK